MANVKVTAKRLVRSALTDELKFKEDNSDAIEIFLSFLTATMLFATEIFHCELLSIPSIPNVE